MGQTSAYKKHALAGEKYAMGADARERATSQDLRVSSWDRCARAAPTTPCGRAFQINSPSIGTDGQSTAERLANYAAAKTMYPATNQAMNTLVVTMNRNEKLSSRRLFFPSNIASILVKRRQLFVAR
jgi:hypothetical protein